MLRMLENKLNHIFHYYSGKEHHHRRFKTEIACTLKMLMMTNRFSGFIYYKTLNFNNLHAYLKALLNLPQTASWKMIFANSIPLWVLDETFYKTYEKRGLLGKVPQKLKDTS